MKTKNIILLFLGTLTIVVQGCNSDKEIVEGLKNRILKAESLSSLSHSRFFGSFNSILLMMSLTSFLVTAKFAYYEVIEIPWPLLAWICFSSY